MNVNPNLPIGFFISVFFIFCATTCALFPRSVPKAFSFLNSYIGLVINEIPFFAFIWLLAVAVLAFAQGDVQSVASWIFFGIAIITAIALCIVVYQNLQAIPVLKKALENLPEKNNLEDVKGFAIMPRFHIAAIPGPFLLRKKSVRRIADIAYGDAGKRNLLDVYVSSNQKKTSPVLIHFHGGGMYHGKKNTQALPLIYGLADRGWTCVSANYRLRPTARYPEHQIDAKKAIAWVRSHAHEFGADPSIIIVAGGSAGGQLACHAALSINDPMFQPGFTESDTSVSAAISFYGYYGWLTSDIINHTNHFNNSIPPMFIIHGDQDQLCPVEVTRNFIAKIRSISSNPVLYAELPHAQHNFDLFHSVRSEAIIDSIEVFGEWLKKRCNIINKR